MITATKSLKSKREKKGISKRDPGKAHSVLLGHGSVVSEGIFQKASITVKTSFFRGRWFIMSAATVDPASATPMTGSKEMSLEEPKKMTREDWRKKKELEEQRKLGNAPAEVDEEGK